MRGSLAGACVYQAHYSCSALSTKHTSIAQHYYYFAQHSTQRTLRMLSIEHSMPLQRCLLSFAQVSYSQVCPIKELESECNRRIRRVCFADIQFYNRVLLLVISSISSKCTSLCILYTVQCTSSEHINTWFHGRHYCC